MMDDELDERLREAASAYHAPPAIPRNEMWKRIAAARRDAEAMARTTGGVPAVEASLSARSAARRLERWRSTGLAAAATVVLAVGIGIGRVSVVPSEPTWEGTGANATAYHLAAQEHLGQSEAFLTLFRTSLQAQSDHRLASASARQLLATNRLLLDSPAAADQRLRLLLEDLELVLAGIAQLSPRSPEEDLELIRETMERGNVMPRLRTAVPAGTTPTQGVL